MDIHKPAMSRSQAFEESENVGRNASANPTMGDIIATRYNRRDLLEELAGGGRDHGYRVASGPGRRPARRGRGTGGQLRLHRGRGRRRRDPSCGARLPCRRPDPLGRPGPAGRPGVRPERADGRRAEAAVRLQQRLRRLLPDRGQLRARPARGEPRVHQRGDHVPQPLRPAGHQGGRLRADDPGSGRRRDGGARRLGAGDPQGRRPLAGRAGQQVQSADHYRRHGDGADRPGRRPRAIADRGRPDAARA